MSGLTLFGQLLIIVIALLLADVGIVYLLVRYVKSRRRTNRIRTGKETARTQEGRDEEETLPEDEMNKEASVEEADIDALLSELEQEELVEVPPEVIRVKNVTMEFKVATVQTSGIKEYLILRLKRQNPYRYLKALDAVSFSIHRGEVVGIIGSNGSGKSTILKIISGAIYPTSGQVKVDKTKVQLLTLGTGFDMELTARENIYLNGAIIGYSKEYIERHFNEIIKFAELEDFVDEKLKNYSSGMVSRLAFAIATSGKAAEILILDEVLSVGDTYFKDKSMRRIKDMIHSGSTVIMVSHSTAVIRTNCTRAIWIEQGVLMADGDVKTVCGKYEEMQNQRKAKL